MNKQELADYRFKETVLIDISNLNIKHINLIKECSEILYVNELASKLVSYIDTKIAFYTCNNFNKNIVKQQLEPIANKYNITIQLNVLVVEPNAY